MSEELRAVAANVMTAADKVLGSPFEDNAHEAELRRGLHELWELVAGAAGSSGAPAPAPTLDAIIDDLERRAEAVRRMPSLAAYEVLVGDLLQVAQASRLAPDAEGAEQEGAER